MAEVIRTYRQDAPAMRFVGKKYGQSDNGYGDRWGEWFERGWFEPLEKLYTEYPAGMEDDGAYIGLMRHAPGTPFEYWIGMFLAADADVPVGYQSIDFESFELGAAWLKGQESEIYAQEDLTMKALAEQGISPDADANGAYWYMERYACPRFTQADEQGRVVLDVCLISRWK